jgi:hypothetical protein
MGEAPGLAVLVGAAIVMPVVATWFGAASSSLYSLGLRQTPKQIRPNRPEDAHVPIFTATKLIVALDQCSLKFTRVG